MLKKTKILFICGIIITLLCFLASCSLSSDPNSKQEKDETVISNPKLTEYDDVIDDTLLMQFTTTHRALAAAIAVVTVENKGTKPQSFSDLSAYLPDIDELLSKPKGATYTLTIDSDNNLTLTSTFGEEELVYTN